jgi:hypothetical protein
VQSSVAQDEWNTLGEGGVLRVMWGHEIPVRLLVAGHSNVAITEKNTGNGAVHESIGPGGFPWDNGYESEHGGITDEAAAVA